MELSGLIYLGIIAIPLILIYRIITSKEGKSTLEKNESPTQELDGFFNFDKKRIKYKTIFSLTNSKLSNVYYWVKNEYNFNLGNIHSVDNAIFLEFERGKWLCIQWNPELEVYQYNLKYEISKSIENELILVNKIPEWENLIGQHIEEIKISYILALNIELITDVIIEFKKDSVYICPTEEFHSFQEEIPFSNDWLAIIFGNIQMKKISREYV